VSNRKYLVLPAAILLIAALVAGFYEYDMHVRGNFGTVTAGEAYRSAQLDTLQLAARLRDHGIRSVVNLRGPSATGAWYRDEIAYSAAHGIAHYDLELMSTKEPSDAQMDSLVALLGRAPRPVLIHCMAGADRTGLAAALWQLTIDGLPPQAARRQLSLRYWHVPWGGTRAMDRAFARYAARRGRIDH